MKRACDILFSFLLLIMLSPVLVIVATLVKIKLGSPILFQQIRPGFNEKLFKLKKFRTMTNIKNRNGELLSDAERLTSFGKFLRSTSLDELPQLINVLKGDISFVGPRPLLVEYLPLYNAQQKKRHAVKPGITGWAQINGRNNLSWEEKFRYDLWYVEHHTFLLDIRILLATLKKVIKKADINSRYAVTMEKFTGTDR